MTALPDDLTIDTSPLITFAIADRLHVLTVPDHSDGQFALSIPQNTV